MEELTHSTQVLPYTYKNEPPEESLDVSIEDSTRLSTTNALPEDIVVKTGPSSENQDLSFTDKLEDFVKNKMSLETYCLPAPVSEKVKDIKTENLPQSHSQCVDGSVKIEDSTYLSINALPEDIVVKTESSSENQDLSFTDKLEDFVKNKMLSETYCLSAGVSDKPEVDIKTENLPQTYSRYVDASVKLENIKTESPPQSHSLYSTANVKLEVEEEDLNEANVEICSRPPQPFTLSQAEHYEHMAPQEMDISDSRSGWADGDVGGSVEGGMDSVGKNLEVPDFRKQINPSIIKANKLLKFKCPHCLVVCLRRADLTRHLVCKHDYSQKKASISSKSGEKVLVNKHQDEHHAGRNGHVFSLSMTAASVNVKQELMDQTEGEGEGKVLTFVEPSPEELAKHDKPYACGNCKKAELSLPDIQRHYNYAHPYKEVRVIYTPDGTEFHCNTFEIYSQVKKSAAATQNFLDAKDSGSMSAWQQTSPHSGETIKPDSKYSNPKMHDYAKPFKCSVCGLRSNWKSDLKKHLRSKHPHDGGFVIILSIEEDQMTYGKECSRSHPKCENQVIVTPDINTPIVNMSPSFDESFSNNDLLALTSGRNKSGQVPCIGTSFDPSRRQWKCSGCDYITNWRRNIARHMSRRHSKENNSLHVISLHMLSKDQQDAKSVYSDPLELTEVAALKQNMISAKILPSLSRSPKISPMKITSRCSVDDKPGYMLKNRVTRKLHKCPKCPYTNTRARNMNQHVMMHGSSESRYMLMRCPYCDYYVGSKRRLSNHMKKLHCVNQADHRHERNRVDFNHPSGSQSEVMVGSNTVIDGREKPFEERVHQTDAVIDGREKPFEERVHQTDTVIDGREKQFEERVRQTDADETQDDCDEWQASTNPQSHIATHSGGKPHECSTCGKAFPWKSSLKTHIRTHTGEKPHKCLACGKAFSATSTLQTHIRTHTGEKPHKCLTCGKAFSHRSTLQKHIRIHTGEKSYECLTCRKAFSTKSRLQTHIRTHTGEKPHECLTCGKTFSITSDLKRHIRTHTGEKPHECLTCGKAFSHTGHLKRHNRTHTGTRRYECLTCGKAFPWKSSLKTHIRTHTGEKPHKCLACGKAFSATSTLQTHIRTHTGEKPHKCLTCGKAFSHRSTLQKHIRIHTGEKSYECLTCRKAFSTKSRLQTHIRTHTGEKPHECLTCGKTFSITSDLKRHIRTPTGEKPHECLTCGKAFSHTGHLKRHNRTHTGTRRYECLTCGEAFSDKTDLQTHIRSHTGEKPHKCLTCGKTFSERSTLKKHIRIHT